LHSRIDVLTRAASAGLASSRGVLRQQQWCNVILTIFGDQTRFLKAIGSINRERLAVSMVSRAGTQLRQRARQIDLHCKSRKKPSAFMSCGLRARLEALCILIETASPSRGPVGHIPSLSEQEQRHSQYHHNRWHERIRPHVRHIVVPVASHTPSSSCQSELFAASSDVSNEKQTIIAPDAAPSSKEPQSTSVM